MHLETLQKRERNLCKRHARERNPVKSKALYDQIKAVRKEIDELVCGIEYESKIDCESKSAKPSKKRPFQLVESINLNKIPH